MTDKTVGNMDITVKIILAAILLLYTRWIVLAILYPLQACWGLYMNHRSNAVCKLLAAPAYIIERFLRFGGVDF